MKKLLALALVGTMTVAMLTACGSKEETTEAPAATEEAATEEAATEEAAAEDAEEPPQAVRPRVMTTARANAKIFFILFLL